LAEESSRKSVTKRLSCSKHDGARRSTLTIVAVLA